LASFAGCDEILRAAIGHRYTGAVVRVQRAGRVVLERAYGRLSSAAGEDPVEVTTGFDLASLTKVFVSTAALRATADGRLVLDAPLTRALPEWAAGTHAAITLRMLLAHTSGMQSGADYRTLLSDRVERFARECPLAAEPGARVIYSDLGFIVLGGVLSRAHGCGLAAVVAAAGSRLGLEATAFRPRNDDPRAFPATERDQWRGRVRGSVHDEKAHLMNGVAGHAGLFGTARDVAVLAEAYLAPAAGRTESILPAELAREAISEQGADPVLRRGLGWALKTSDENSCGAMMDRSTFGHTGFTGTCIWADPVRDLSVVLLTNAVYYGRRDLRDLRAAVCDAAMRDFG
jgi:CubicO group peptidase (beta-lactamase class C family)